MPEILDKRCRHKLRFNQPYYLFLRNPRNHIFYVRYKDGPTLSTGQIQINKAVEFAEKNFIDRTPQKIDLHYLLTHYYLKDSKYVAYDRSHGITLDDKAVKSAFFRMIKIGELLPDCRTYKDVTRSRLIRLQEQLKELNFSAKTINNYMTDFRRIFNQLYDKELIETNPFINLKQIKGEKKAWTCFPINIIKGKWDDSKYSLMAYIATATGARHGEFFNWKMNGNLLTIYGSKSVYSVRTVPINDTIKSKIEALEKMKDQVKNIDYYYCSQHMQKVLNYYDQGIVFHSFRKMYKTILTSANLNTTLIETLMGHTTNNQQSNDVERIYFVEDKADLSKAYRLVIEALEKYL